MQTKPNEIAIPPRKPVTEVGSNRALMAVGAHADDIEFNVGGTILKYRDIGYAIDYVMSTNNFSGDWKIRNPDGSLTRERPHWERMMAKRKEEAAAAAARVGTEPVHLDHPQRHYINAKGEKVRLRYGAEVPGPFGRDTPTILTAYEDPGAVRRLADLIMERNPEAVLVHGMITNNIEHTGTCLLTTRAYWQAVKQGYTGMLLHWHEMGVGDFADTYLRWDTYIDVTDVWDRKIEWIGVHASMVPHPSEAEHASRDVVYGCAQAEAYNLVSRGRRYYDNLPFGCEIRTHFGRCRR